MDGRADGRCVRADVSTIVDAVAQRDHKKGTNKTETDPEMQRRPGDAVARRAISRSVLRDLCDPLYALNPSLASTRQASGRALHPEELAKVRSLAALAAEVALLRALATPATQRP